MLPQDNLNTQSESPAIGSVNPQQSVTLVHSEDGTGYSDGAIEYFNASGQESYPTSSFPLMSNTDSGQQSAIGIEESHSLGNSHFAISNHRAKNTQIQGDFLDNQEPREDSPTMRIFYTFFTDWNDTPQRQTYKNAMKSADAAIEPFLRLDIRWSDMDRRLKELIVEQFTSNFMRSLK